MGGGGVGGGMAPPLQKPDISAMQDYHGPDGSDPKNPNGALPPVVGKVARATRNRLNSRPKPINR